MNLIELALTTYTEGTAAKAERAEEYAAEARDELLRLARACASSTLSTDAADLDWQYTTEGLPESLEEARAFLTAGRPEYLRYRIDHKDPDVQVSFELVQPCLACEHDRVSPVTGLFHLGQLLHQEPHPDTHEAPATEPGPLAAIERLHAVFTRADRVAQRLIAQHPDASLTVTNASLFGHEHGDGLAKLRFQSTSISQARQLARVLGTELTTQIKGDTGRYATVIEHGHAETVIDGVEVDLSVYTHLTVDEAAAWRAQQDQATEAGDA
jgi:hypothetical protein